MTAGGTGLAVGTTVGMTAGAVSGGAAGYGAYARKDDIQEMRTRAISRVSSGWKIGDYFQSHWAEYEETLLELKFKSVEFKSSKNFGIWQQNETINII